MRRVRESLVSALAGVFGLPVDDRALWPDIILGAALAFALVFSLGSLVTFVFDFTFVVSTITAIVLILLAKEKKAVLGGALLFVGLRSLIALITHFELRATVLAVSSFLISGCLLLGYRRGRES